MNIIAYFSLYGTPSTGLSPTIRIRDISDNTLIVTDVAMSEIGDGFYKYAFAAYNNAKEYSIRCDGGATLAGTERYPVAITTGYGELRIIKTQTDKMAFTVANQIDSNILTQANIDFGALQKASLNAATPAVTVSDKAGFSLSATGADLILKSSTFIQAIVAAINELATYGLTAINTLLITTGIKTATTAAPADMALNSTVGKETTLVTIAGYIDTEIGTIATAVGTTIPNAIAALPTDADVNAACDTAISDAALATAAILKEVNQSLNGASIVIDRGANTFKVYDTDGTTLLFTITKTTVGNVDTLTRT